MAISIQRTSDVHVAGVNILVYGPAGAGKTTLIKTLPAPIILSAEGGLLSLSGTDIPYIQITSMADLLEAYEYAKDSTEFESIALDSISEIAEVVLSHEKKQTKDPRQAYGAMQEHMAGIVRSFRDIPNKNTYMSAKVEKVQDDSGRLLYAPSMPGNKTAQALPYFFDEVLALRIEKDDAGNTQRALMCDSDGLWSAKDRSGKLSSWEVPNLGAIINKIRGEL